MMKKSGIGVLGWVLLLLAITFGLQASPGGDEREGKMPAVASKEGSLAWQIEELLSWLMKTRNLVPKPQECQPPCYVLEALSFGGDARSNQLTFTLTGNVIADQAILVPLFGPAQQVILKNVKINGQNAVIGFEGEEYYYVRTAEKRFTISGELSLFGEKSLYLPGHVNLFRAAVNNGRIVEGNQIPGLSQATLHLELTGRTEKAAESLPPVFQLARAIRVRKDITFEYKVSLQSGREIPGVTIPLSAGETVLEVPGIMGWKQEKGELTVPVSGKEVGFSVLGRIAKLQPMDTDQRSSYEWWLIESDPEHRTLVETEGKQVDSSESPIARQLSMSKLFLLGRGQKLEIKVRPLVDREALAVIVNQQFREVIWTRDGDLVAEDSLIYQNNGIDYLPFDCGGKPVYLETDGEARKILAENNDKPAEIYIPLNKGQHTAKVQSTSAHKPGLFFGRLRLPVARHGLSISKSTLILGLPERIKPLWFSGGEGISSPVDWTDLLFLAIALVICLVFFKGGRLRLLGLVALGGLYFALPLVFYIGMALFAICLVFLLINRRTQGKKRLMWSTVAAAALLLVFILIYVVYLSEPGDLSPAAAGITSLDQSRYDESLRMQRATLERVKQEVQLKDMEEQRKIMADKKYMPEEASRSREEAERSAQVAVQQVEPQPQTGSMFFSSKNIIEGVVPVPLPLPSYSRQVFLTRELVTPARPLRATLVYVTSAVTLPLLLLWLLACTYLLYLLRGNLRNIWIAFLGLWKGEATPPQPEKE